MADLMERRPNGSSRTVVPGRAAPYRVTLISAAAGGGHLRAAEALKEALLLRYGDAVQIQEVDFLREYAPFPFNRLPEIYGRWIELSARTYGWVHALTDGHRRSAFIMRALWPRVWPGVRRLLHDHPADLLICTHSLENHMLVWGLKRLGRPSPLVTVVTDPVSAHAAWLGPKTDLCLVGGREVRRKALSAGISADRVRVTGLPVNPRFVAGLTDRAEAHRQLGWTDDRPVILLVGGGDGVGRLLEIVRELDRRCPEARIAVVSGRNGRLRRRLEQADWRAQVQDFGLVDHATEMSRLMSAADVLVTKAGPGTLHDAFLAGLPVVLSGAIPRQEDGNVRSVVESGAGVWAPKPRRAAAAAAALVSGPRPDLERMALRSRSLARPDAAHRAADEVWSLLTRRSGGASAPEPEASPAAAPARRPAGFRAPRRPPRTREIPEGGALG